MNNPSFEHLPEIQLTPTPKPKTSKLFTLSSALLAFIIWGAWAYYINHSEGSSAGLVSGIAQGSASFIITLVMVRAVSWLFARMQNSNFRFLFPPFITVACTASCLYGLHTMVGTVNIIQTITPALTVAFIFCLFTTYKLNRSRCKNI